jgi:uroporphyrin-III C-methyltransferase / precorrin-2 dehydrogenase / sirohydrochlorin ferrochelatase
VNGFVSLVGAGPGDPDLLTLKAARCLSEADLVLYDALVSPAVLDLARHAQRFFVGKRARKKAVAQETIHGLMIRAARRGKRVVRLKCGDPFVFGRGGEEALALARAGIPFEVVPGVSSAVAAPALAGIPVTHRGVSAGFVVVSGHHESAYGKILSAVAPNSLTVVVLMGLATRAALASFLVARGWNPSTPVALLLAASTAAAETWTGTLAELADAPVLAADNDSPGTLVVGEVVSVAAELAQTVIAETAVASSRRHS